MIIDVNAWVGHWPFRRLRHNTVPGLLRLMDRSGIDRAVVASIHGVFYRNVHPANEELARQVLRHRDRLIPFATLNPAYRDGRRTCAGARKTWSCAGFACIRNITGMSRTRAPRWTFWMPLRTWGGPFRRPCESWTAGNGIPGTWPMI